MFVVAIPSYRRANAISNKTLATLAIGGVPVSDIYIFVVADEQADYERACPEYKVVVGQLGLVAQRKFIPRDLGGTASCTEVTRAVCDNLK